MHIKGLFLPSQIMYIVNNYGQYVWFLSSRGSSVQPAYFPWTPVTFLTTHINFCSSRDMLLPTPAPSWVSLVCFSAVWDISQWQHLIQKILQGLGCHPFSPSHPIHSSCRGDIGKCRSLNNKASHQCPLYFKRPLEFGWYFLSVFHYLNPSLL